MNQFIILCKHNDISNDILNGKIQLDKVEKALGRIRKGKVSEFRLSYILRTLNISHLYLFTDNIIQYHFRFGRLSR